MSLSFGLPPRPAPVRVTGGDPGMRPEVPWGSQPSALQPAIPALEQDKVRGEGVRVQHSTTFLLSYVAEPRRATALPQRRANLAVS